MRLRVALLMDTVEDQYEAGIVRGVVRAAAYSEVALVCVAGGVIGCPRNFLFDLLDPQQFDGLLVLSGALGNGLGAARIAGWLQRFAGKPTVNLGVEIPGSASIAVNGAAGMTAIVSHLIEVHQRKRIAFVCGPETSEEAAERYAAYKTALDDYGIALDPRLVTKGSWLRESGAQAVRELFDVRGLLPKSDGRSPASPEPGRNWVDAIVCADDSMAMGVLDELLARGIDVPGQIAVTGFDDIEASRSVAPPLTTVRQPMDALGREGLRRLVSMMNGNDEIHSSRIVAEVCQRRSCGCTMTRPTKSPRTPSTQGRSFEAAFMDRRSLTVVEMARAAQGLFFGAGIGWEDQLAKALLRDVIDGESAFTAAIDQILGKVQRAGGDIGVAADILVALRRGVLACSAEDPSVLSDVEDVLDAARDLVSEWLVRAERLRTTEILHQLQEISGMASLLLGASGAPAVREGFEARLRGLHLPSASIGLFTEPGRVGEECVSLVGYAGAKSLKGTDRFRSRDLGHAELRKSEEALLVQPLLYDDEPLGIATLGWGALDEAVYEQARKMLGVGLKAFASRGVASAQGAQPKRGVGDGYVAVPKA
jgi:DNA-binding LacI/PurR family transcriptional regulator